MQESLVIKGVTIVDTRTGKLRAEKDVFIKNGIISGILPSGTAPDDLPDRTIEAHGKFMVPGFWDMHAHILEEDHREVSLDLMLAYGITGWRQMSGSPKILAERKNGKLMFGPDAPELLEMPGQILTPANAATPKISITEVQKQKAQGADFIKTITLTPQTFLASCREARRLGLGYAGHLSLGVSAEEASQAGMTAIEHLGPLDLQLISCSSRGWLVKIILKLKPPPAPDLSPEKMATVGKLIVANPTLFRLQMDPDGLTKSQRLVDSFSDAKCRNLAKVCVENQTWQVPTLIRIETMQFAEEPRFAEDPNLRFIPASTRHFWASVAEQFAEKITPQGKITLQRMMEKALRMTKIFDECGVKMLAGSDYGGMWVIPGASLHQEFDLLSKAGLSPLRILQTTTLDAAEFLGRQASDGAVEERKAANLVLLHSNPIEDVKNLHDIHAVIRSGRYLSAPQLDALKSGAAQQVASM